MENTLNYRLFTWVAASKLLCIEASTLAGYLDTAYCADELTVVGRRNAVCYTQTGTRQDHEGETVAWVYEPTTASVADVPECRGTRVFVYND